MSPVDLNLRTARADDLPGLLELYRHLNPNDVQIPEELARTIWKRMLDHPGFTCVVVVAGSSPSPHAV